MRDLIVLLVHVVTTVLRLAQPGGVRAVIAESVLAKHQLLILNRSRRRAPNLRILDRLIAGFCSLWITPKRRCRLAIAFKPSTFLSVESYRGIQRDSLSAPSDFNGYGRSRRGRRVFRIEPV